ncbi:MAG: HupE/UreJ family protein [Gemmatimonadales bacterium]
MPARRLIARAAALVLLGSSLAGAGLLFGHEIPRHVTIRAFVRPEGTRLVLVVRAPVEALRDIDFPLKGGEMLDLGAAGPLAVQGVHQWLGDYLAGYENGLRLPDPELTALRISLPADGAFQSLEAAVAHLGEPPLDTTVAIPWRQAVVDARFEFPIASAESRFSLDAAWSHLGIETLTVLAFTPADGPERVFQYLGNPGVVRLDPRWSEAARRFVVSGIEHILGGLDHLLFLLCLLIPVRGVLTLVPVVTAFTVAHSITLVAAALGLAPDAAWFPALVETLIAASVLWLAIENVLGVRPERRWAVAFGFGLIHGFGLSFALRDSLQFAGRHLLSSLLAFNVGVELGQLAALIVATPVIVFLFRRIPDRVGVVVLSVLVGHASWHWMTERWGVFRQFDLTLPAAGPALAALALRWAAVALLAAAAAAALGWFARRWRDRIGPDLVDVTRKLRWRPDPS